MQNAIPTDRAVSGEADDVATRVARRTLAKRGAAYADEVRRLLDAALELMQQGGTAAPPRVADIVATAGLSNDAFYRHFPSKDALVATLIEDGAERLAGYVGHRMDKEPTAEGRVRAFVEGVLSQCDEEVAASTLAVLANAATAGRGRASRRQFASAQLAPLLRGPYADLGSTDPELAASLATHATLGVLTDHLWAQTRPSAEDIVAIVDFCLATVRRDPRG
ncbi:MAG TPA: helix-turn-helix domain-containing protein [Acidimicrobiia bacterium]